MYLCQIHYKTSIMIFRQFKKTSNNLNYFKMIITYQYQSKEINKSKKRGIMIK